MAKVLGVPRRHSLQFKPSITALALVLTFFVQKEVDIYMQTGKRSIFTNTFKFLVVTRDVSLSMNTSPTIRIITLLNPTINLEKYK